MNWINDKKELRRFALILSIAFLIIALLLSRKHETLGHYLLVVPFVLSLFGLISPKSLAPFARRWMQFAEKLSVVMTFVILTLTYFLVVTPMAVLLRVLGKDLLSLRLDKDAKSYWTKVEENGPSTRYYTPY